MCVCVGVCVCVWGGGDRKGGCCVDVCVSVWRGERGAWVWVWLWRGRIKIMIINIVPVNVLYDDHMCAILFILRHTSVSNILYSIEIMLVAFVLVPNCICSCPSLGLHQ